MKKIKYAFKDLIKTIFRSLGYRLVPVRVMEQYAVSENAFLKNYFEADEFANLPSDRSGDDFLKERRFDSLHQMVRHVLNKNISGDFAECGCKHGHSTYLIADEMRKVDTSRDLWVFDSFEGGLSDKGDKDRTTKLADTNVRSTQIQKERFSSQYNHVQSVFKGMPFVHLVKGWIPDTFTDDLGDKNFAFVHLDVDLYEPTKSSLDFFYSRLSDGGVIVVDDYNSATFPGARIAVQELLEEQKYSLFIESQLMGCIIVK